MLSATETEADRAPAEVGVKVTEIAQLAPIATLVPQLLVSLKSAALVPPIATEETLTLTDPVTFSEVAWGLLVMPTFCGPNGAGNFQLRGGGGSERFNLP